ncbi:4-(cytidine 5'-diphospho)-2-C-methyl-D-erythritol kinase [Pullulanibacillus sp. KACC 23026]|uniref:4-(cytidine 5'-diphospho)-2-C-methyl-D-erythritol kinase n=1 Tax=Pullulanibacillus sp. KACC 23026 TaxID=3028315 RepID=UPI0023AFFA66|nr:4-(cytidine 5'-diphospho)-2-C-methyl-D-erythritol kinase [Pullulanibacillus sp. KACC 23026]WEG12736.1 4-(cytidine 5'-diphospho)-2-C-methyl-D-erythritol kinase [Pullulanibacillus sp. KACC 23026]
MKTIEKAPAKINLSLDVLHKRPDGYHEVEMVMTTVDLSDRLELQEIRDYDQILIRSSAPFVPEDERNLAYQAAKHIKQKYGVKTGVRINITKDIPVAAGLAGGSSDAAAVIRALNRLWSLNMTLDEMMEIGEKIGSDVPFCIVGGTALATGRGERLEMLSSPPPCWVVLAKPSISVSTADTYKALNLEGAAHPNVSEMVRAIANRDYNEMCSKLGNILESVTLSKVAEVEQLKTHMEQMGADGVLMSGSGPTVFGLTQYESRVNRIYNSLKGYCPNVFGVRLLGTPNSLD